MRTTLDIDVDVLAVAKELAASQRKTAGKVISELARKGLQSRRAKGNGKQWWRDDATHAHSELMNSIIL